MDNVYQNTAYRSHAIPALPPGGHPKLDHGFQRLSWGNYQMPVVPSTMEAQLAYARLFQEESDAEDGFPWGESFFSVSKGFLARLQGSLYMIYMCAAVMFFISFFPLLIGIIGVAIHHPNLKGIILLYDGMKYIYLAIAICYFGGKYGRLLLAYLSVKRGRASHTGLYRRDGMVRIQKGRSLFEAPFIEFDAYLVHGPSGRGGRYFNLVLQHRYSPQQLWMKGLLTDAMDPKEVYAYWDMIQQFMDVTRPLPDVPIFEPFRSRDPVTRARDERFGRDPWKWRKISPEDWRNNHEWTYRQQLQDTHFHRPCILDARIQGRGLPLPDDEPRGVLVA